MFLFGGADGIAAAAALLQRFVEQLPMCRVAFSCSLRSGEELSKDTIIEAINASGAELLVVSLGAKKGQSWLVRNGDKLRIPIRAHLGAWINFEAGAVKRAPMIMQTWGLEWVWKNEEEPLPLEIITGMTELLYCNCYACEYFLLIIDLLRKVTQNCQHRSILHVLVKEKLV